MSAQTAAPQAPGQAKTTTDTIGGESYLVKEIADGIFVEVSVLAHFPEIDFKASVERALAGFDFVPARTKVIPHKWGWEGVHSVGIVFETADAFELRSHMTQRPKISKPGSIMVPLMKT